jgi:glycosyltransferase involved in cell wall biosynthesis
MTEKILDLLKNPQKAKQFGEAGYQRVKKHFSLNAHVAQTITWYQKLTLNKD